MLALISLRVRVSTSVLRLLFLIQKLKKGKPFLQIFVRASLKVSTKDKQMTIIRLILGLRKYLFLKVQNKKEAKEKLPQDLSKVI